MCQLNSVVWCSLLLVIVYATENQGNSTRENGGNDTVQYESHVNFVIPLNHKTNLTWDDEESVQQEYGSNYMKNYYEKGNQDVSAKLCNNSTKITNEENFTSYELGLKNKPDEGYFDKICSNRAYVPICCDLGYRLIDGICMSDASYYPFPEVNETGKKVDDIFQFIVSNPCKKTKRYLLYPEENDKDKYVILSNGSIYLQNMDFIVRHYCFAVMNRNIYEPTICFGKKKNSDKKFYATYIGLIVSLPFLLLTFVVYTILPELWNMHGYTLRGYIGSLFIAYTALTMLQMISPQILAKHVCITLVSIISSASQQLTFLCDANFTCKKYPNRWVNECTLDFTNAWTFPRSRVTEHFLPGPFVIHFSFLASFFWLNVVCFDLWRKIGECRNPLQRNTRQEDKKKFIMYSIYAWGCASALTIVCVIMNFIPNVPKNFIRPEFGEMKCWYTTNKAKALYFYGPASVTIICNICLFISTILKFVRHKKSTASHLITSIRHHDDKKQWLKLYVKLFIMMGITWSLEIISWLFEDVPPYIWYLSDLMNSLQGLIIFITFVWRDKIKTRLLKRFNCEKYTYLLFFRNLQRNNCNNMALHTYPLTAEMIPLQEQIRIYRKVFKTRKNCHTKNSSNESACP